MIERQLSKLERFTIENKFEKIETEQIIMTGAPVACETFLVPRSSFSQSCVWAALDAGNSLLKLIYVVKQEVNSESQMITVRGRIYRYGNINAALQEMRDNCYIPAGSELRVTGVWITPYRKEIESFLCVKLCFVDELLAQTFGMHFLLENAEGDLCLPALGLNPCFDPPDVPIILERRPHLLERMTANNHDSMQGVCPANFIVIGSAIVFTHMDSKKRIFLRHMTMLGGLSFMAFAKLLLGTDDYDEIMDLASRGSQKGNGIDISVGDWAPGGEVNAQCPLSLFAFGKMAGASVGQPSREDVAASLVGFLAEIVFTLALDVAERTGISRFYVGGNWIRASAARQALVKQWSLFHPSAIEFKFFRSGIATALGTALLNLSNGGEN